MLYWLQEKFGFSKKELNGITVLMLVIFISCSLPFIYELMNTPEPIYFERLMVAENKLGQIVENKEDKNEKPIDYFKFDPNNLSAADWQRLGLHARQIENIKNFKAKGGRFYKREDFLKLYTISEDDYNRLAPFIQIAVTQTQEAAIERVKDIPVPNNRIKHAQPISKIYPTLEINTVDSLALLELPGIGPVFASRIVRYRNLLGGFYTIEQLKEVYGMDPERYQQITPFLTVSNTSISQIAINKVDVDELRKHPYFTGKYARLIVQYRKQHGAFKHINDLLGIALINDDYLHKIAPYLLMDND